MQTFEQDPADVLPYEVDFTAECARVRKPDTDYATSTRVRPAKSNGMQYNASTGGRTGSQEPRWPTTIGATVADGSVTWTAETAGSQSLERTLSSASWNADTGLTVAGQATSGNSASAKLSGGTLGQSYLVRVAGTFSDGTTRNACFGMTISRPRAA